MVMAFYWTALVGSKNFKWLALPAFGGSLFGFMVKSSHFASQNMGSPLIDSNSPLAPLFFSLTIWSVGAATLAWLTLKSESNTFVRLMGALLTVLMASFSTHSLIIFYFMFELSLIPIFLLVLGWGYQPERSYAGLSMVFYTLVASLPLLTYSALTTTYASSSEMIMTAHFMLPSSGNCKFWVSLFLSGGFLIKLPIFGGHLWLPRAHVEAPMEGSMLLAAIMLKLGGYGLIFISPIILPSSATNLISAFSLAGGALIALTCLRQTDAKMLIAYSSVAHMSLALASSLSGKILGVWAAVLAYISHGFVSSGLFMGANFLYLRSSSRNITALAGHLSYLPLFSMSWFILCMGNMGAPPTPNLLAEIFMIASLFLKSASLLAPSLLMAALATAFTLNLYMATQHSAPPGAAKWANPLTAMEIVSLISHSLLAIMGASALVSLM